MQNNDDHRFETQIIECHRVAMMEARRRGLSSDDSEDVAQEVCIALWTALMVEKPIRSIGAWSRTAAARRIVDLHRQALSSKRGGGLIESLADHLEESAFAHRPK